MIINLIKKSQFIVVALFLLNHKNFTEINIKNGKILLNIS